MANNYTPNINLALTPADTTETFKAWREKLDDNLEIIDAMFGEDSEFFALAGRGSHIYCGNDMTGTSTTTNAHSYSSCPEAKVDDFYINTTNGNVYTCTTAGTGTAAKWTYKYNITGAKGDKGDKGDQGVSISSVTQTTTSSADGGENVVTVTLSNGSKSIFKVKNGSKGSPGTNGSNGTDGDDGIGIASIKQITNNTGNGEANTIRITLTDNTTYDVTVYNGSATAPDVEYGLRWVTGQSDPAGERVTQQDGVMKIGGNTGMAFNVESDGSFTSSYDKAYPWSEMERITLKGQVMVKVPKYYICLETVGGYDYMWVCKSPVREGYRCASIFLQADGKTENDYYYIGAYEADCDHLATSQSNHIYGKTNRKLSEHRTAAQALGSGWGITTMAECGDFWQILMPIEFGTRDVQSVAAGICSLIDGPFEDVYEDIGYHVGMTDSVANHHGIALVTDSAPDGTNYNYNKQTGLNCGANPFVYRGIENPYGCLEKWVDGLTFYNGTCYTTNNRTAFKTDSIAGYTQLGYNHATEYGYVKTLGYDANVPYCRIPTEVTQTSGTYYPDCWDYYAGSGCYYATFGGYGDGGFFGVWYFLVYFTSSGSDYGVVSRLSYSPV